MMTPTKPRTPPAAEPETETERGAAALGELEADAAESLALALPLDPESAPADVRDGPELLDGLAMGDPVVEGS